MSMTNKRKKTLKLIAKREITHDKIFSCLLLMGIFLASTLLMGALLISGQMEKMNATRLGTWTAMYQDVDSDSISDLLQEDSILSYGISASIDSVTTQDFRINILYADENAFTLCGLTLKSGNLPSTDDEILMEEDFTNENGKKISVGDLIELDFEGGKTFTVCGTYSTSATNMSRKTYGAFVSEKHIVLNNNIPKTLYLSLNMTDKSQIQMELAHFREKYNLTNQFTINEDYLNMQGQSWIYKLFAVGMAIIILMLAYFTVYCIFFISVVNNVKDYGQLRLIGVTNKQIEYITNHKFIILLVLGIPLGCLTGGIVGYLVIPETFSTMNCVITVVEVAICVGLIVLVATRKPLKIVKSMSLIESSRFNGIELNKTHKTNKCMTPISMAKLYIKRYRKKVNLTVMLLTLSGTMFIVCASILAALDAKEMSKQNFPDENCHIAISNEILRDSPLEKIQINNPLTDNLIDEIQNTKGVKEVWVQMYLPFSIENSEIESSGAITSFTEKEYEAVKQCLVEGELPLYNEWGQNDIVVGRKNQFEESFGLDLKCGDKLKLYIYDGGKKVEEEFNIIGILDEKQSIEEKFDMLLMPDTCLKTKVSTNINDIIYIKTDGSEEADQKILSTVSGIDEISTETLTEVIEQNEMFMYSFRVIIYIILTFLSVFSILNLLNTLLTNTIVRKNEFKTIQNVGMSRRQLKRMLIWEGEIIVLKSLILTCFIGILVGRIICTALVNSGFSYITYKIPILAIIVCIVVASLSAFLGTGVLGINLVCSKSKQKRKR